MSPSSRSCLFTHSPMSVQPASRTACGRVARRAASSSTLRGARNCRPAGVAVVEHVLALQHDPQPMIDAMVETIPDRKGAYRTMMPEDAVVETKLAQQLGWTQNAR